MNLCPNMLKREMPQLAARATKRKGQRDRATDRQTETRRKGEFIIID
jgi:hypothetical protein